MLAAAKGEQFVSSGEMGKGTALANLYKWHRASEVKHGHQIVMRKQKNRDEVARSQSI